MAKTFITVKPLLSFFQLSDVKHCECYMYKKGTPENWDFLLDELAIIWTEILYTVYHMRFQGQF